MTAPFLFERDGARVVPHPVCTGPWDPSAMHGGPPTLLLGRAFADHGDVESFHLARLSVELIRQVPVEPLTVEVRVLRGGRRIELLEGAIRRADGTEVVHGRALRIRRSPDDELATSPPLTDARSPADASPFRHGYPRPDDGFYMDAFDIRSIGPAFTDPGPAAAWFRLLVPVFADEAIGPLDRVLAVSDFGNGISNMVPTTGHLYINPDLTVNLHRLPVGEWVRNDAVTAIGPDGVGTATGRLADADGLVGTANQSLIVQRTA